MKKHLNAVIAMLSILSCLSARGADISGTFQEYLTGNPIDKASVVVICNGQELKEKATITDSHGQFVITDLPSGNVELQFFKIGYLEYPSKLKTAMGAADVGKQVVEAITNDSSYFDRVINSLQAQGGGAPAMESTWIHLKSALDTDAAVDLAKYFMSKAPALAAKSPDLINFSKADLAAVKLAQSKVKTNLVTPQQIPSLTTLAATNLPNEVTAHMIAKEATSRFSAKDLKILQAGSSVAWGEDLSKTLKVTVQQMSDK